MHFFSQIDIFEKRSFQHQTKTVFHSLCRYRSIKDVFVVSAGEETEIHAPAQPYLFTCWAKHISASQPFTYAVESEMYPSV